MNPGSGVGATFLSGNQTHRYLEMANYTCINTDAMVIQGNLSLQCQGNGEWSDSPPVCGE